MLGALNITRKESEYWSGESKAMDATLFGERLLSQKHSILDPKGPANTHPRYLRQRGAPVTCSLQESHSDRPLPQMSESVHLSHCTPTALALLDPSGRPSDMWEPESLPSWGLSLSRLTSPWTLWAVTQFPVSLPLVGSFRYAPV